jgi:N-carbamoylputrescine amidase
MTTRILSTLMAFVLTLGLLAPTSLAEEKAPAMEDNTVRLAMMRGIPEKWNVEANFKVFLEQLEAADKAGADVLITPECFLDGYASPHEDSTPEKLRAIAQDLDTSPYIQRVAEEAKKRSMYICFGFTSLEDGEIYNAAGLWDDQGELVGIYHKTHLQNHDLQYAKGEGFPVWETKWGKVGMMICADRRWPETARSLRLQGAKLILNPTYGFYGDFNTAMMRTRAFENQCFIAFTHPKQSLITGPKGAVEEQEDGEGEPGITIHEIDLTRAKDNNHLQDRRPDLYGDFKAEE